MPTSAQTLKLIRQIHLYFGVFIAPALLFFALTGALQTFSLHETTRGSSYKPPTWIVTLAQLHKKQTATVPVKKQAPNGDKAGGDKSSGDKPTGDKVKMKMDKGDGGVVGSAVAPKAADAASVPAAPAPKPKSHLPMKIFFLLVAVGLFTSTLTGIYMAYKYNRSKLVVTLLLLAGIVVPLLLLPF
jgi:hypothetical protein